MAKQRYVLDASALLCLLFDQPGAGQVEAVLHGALISAASYAQVIGTLIDRGHSPEEAVADLTELDLDVVTLDRAQSEAAGALRAPTRQADLSLDGRACLALAKTSGRIALTADQAWSEFAEAAGVAVELIASPKV